MRNILFAVAFALAPLAVEACTVRTLFDVAQIDGAEIVLVGKVTEFRMIEAVWGAALVTVEVEEVLKGRAPEDVTFIWNAGMAQGPSDSVAQGRVLIGAMEGGRIAVSDRVPDARPDLPSIVQPYCGEVWMQPATAGMVAAAKEALE